MKTQDASQDLQAYVEKMMADLNPPDRIIANWGIDVGSIKRYLHIRKKHMTSNDWVVLKKFDFGELGFDREEGLRFETTVGKISALVEWVRYFYDDRSAGFTHNGRAKFTCMLSRPMSAPEGTTEVLEACGLVKTSKFGWELQS